ncbi:hypothetical protein PC128_g16550 [Phytophthora cactorum]|nr:hypothetical protein PC128_g16550 [Phytophthora cactorum]
MSLCSMSALLFDVAKPALFELLRREKNVESPQMRKVKSSKSMLKTTGESASSQLKREFVAAMKIVRATRAYKLLGVNLDKIKAALVVAFSAMNSAISADETMLQRPTSVQERLEFDIRSSPLASYDVSMHLRVNGEKGKKKKKRKKK